MVYGRVERAWAPELARLSYSPASLSACCPMWGKLLHFLKTRCLSGLLGGFRILCMNAMLSAWQVIGTRNSSC